MTGHLHEGSGSSGAVGLHTDLYELRMVDSYVRRGMFAPATFSLFIRPSPKRPWHLAFGVHRVLEMLEAFRYGPTELAYLRQLGLSQEAVRWLEGFEPSGEVRAVPDGTVVLANEPILEITAPLPVAQLLETAVINLVQFPTLIATKAARLAFAAQGRPVVDFGFRRAQGLETGVEAALAAHVGGGMTTSNVEAGRRFGIDVAGTMAHSFVQAFDREIDAFRAFAEDHPDNIVLLVDTYDSLEGVRNAITIADEMQGRGVEIRAIRLDSGDLAELAGQARRMLDDAGHPEVRIFASGGLDEEKVAALVGAGAPIDAFGVGSTLVVSADQPAYNIAYKLVSYEGEGRAKYSDDKATLPGEKQIFRADGPESDVLGLRDERGPGDGLLEVVWRDGERLVSFDLASVRERAAKELTAIPEEWRLPSEIESPLPRPSESLERLAERIRLRA